MAVVIYISFKRVSLLFRTYSPCSVYSTVVASIIVARYAYFLALPFSIIMSRTIHWWCSKAWCIRVFSKATSRDDWSRKWRSTNDTQQWFRVTRSMFFRWPCSVSMLFTRKIRWLITEDANRSPSIYAWIYHITRRLCQI